MKKLAKERLSSKRYKHVKNVVAAAVSLAEIYDEDPEKAAMAAWLHDICKELPKEDLLRLLEQDAIIAKSTVQKPVPVWHGACAAVYAKQELGVTDEDVLSAVACHTTGKPNMTKLDKIIYLADLTSAERDFDGVDTYRKLAKGSLDKAMLVALRDSIKHIKKAKKPLDEDTIKALEYFEKLQK